MKALIAQAMKALIGEVFNLVDDRTPLPPAFWDKVADLSGELAAAVIANGRMDDVALEPYYQELHSLMRRYNLLETV